MNTIKHLCVSFLLLSSLFSASQKSVILKNVNSRANELKHELNASEDSLILKGERNIYRVEIFNQEFRLEFKTNTKDLRIPLQEIPVGRFVTLVRLRDKIIAISLLRNENYDVIKPPALELDVVAKTRKVIPPKTREKKVKETVTKASLVVRKIKGYWIVKVSRGHLGEKVTRRFAKENEIEKLIAHTEHEIKTKAGKFNNITIWEVYDIAEFKRLKAMDKDIVRTVKSNAFNFTPHYETKSKVDIDSN